MHVHVAGTDESWQFSDAAARFLAHLLGPLPGVAQGGAPRAGLACRHTLRRVALLCDAGVKKHSIQGF